LWHGRSLGCGKIAGSTDKGQNNTTCHSVLRFENQQFEQANKLDLGLISSQPAKNAYLTSLILSFNKLNDTDAKTLACGLRKNRVLQELDLRANQICDAGTITLTELVLLVANQHAAFIKLFLYMYLFGGEGGRALVQSIRGNSIFLILNMDYNSWCSYDEIQFCTYYLNWAGWQLLKEDHLNPTIWPLVLERAQNVSRDSRGICKGYLHICRAPF
jgi:hypothetical protein